MIFSEFKLLLLFNLSWVGWQSQSFIMAAAMPNPGGPAHHFASRLHTREDDLAGFGDTISVLGMVSETL